MGKGSDCLISFWTKQIAQGDSGEMGPQATKPPPRPQHRSGAIPLPLALALGEAGVSFHSRAGSPVLPSGSPVLSS